jgi:hypothetical protein
MRLSEVMNAAEELFRNNANALAYIDYVDDMRHVLEDDQIIAFMELERVCLGEGAMEVRALMLKHLKECRECHGQRYVTNGCHYAHGDYDEETCPACDGTGQHLTSEEIAELYTEAHAILEEWHEDCDE